MDRVKKTVHYWCAETINRTCTGRGVTAAILDTGIAPHPDFRGRIVAFKDCVRRRTGLYDDCGHGTHVAGILAGDGKLSGGVLSGMAPETDLVVIKVLDEKGEGNLAQIFEGIYWLRQNWRRFGVRIVNISVGARTGLNEEKEKRLVEAVEYLWDAGLAVMVSAGNYGPGEGTVAIPGTSRKVITVGAVGGSGKGQVCSGRGPTDACVVKPDLVAPGFQIISCNNVSFKERKPYTVKSGTSMATPVVSGAAALLLSQQPETSNVELKLKLRESCRRMSGPEGWGCLDVEHLLGTGDF